MQAIEDANQEAVRRMLAGDPVLLDVHRAGDVIDSLDKHVFLHAGPPIEWERMCGPMQGAICGAAIDRKSVRVGKECRSRWSPYH